MGMKAQKQTNGAEAGGLSRRDRILHAAMELFSQSDYGDVATRDIADRAEVSLRLMWYHFKSKEELRDAVDAMVLDQLSDLTRNAYTGSVEERFAATIDDSAAMGPNSVLLLYVRRMLLDESERGKRLFQGILDRLYRIFEQPGDPATYSSERRQHEVALISLFLGPILLKPHFDHRYGVDIHGKAEREGRIAASVPLFKAAIAQIDGADA
jgi:AcrR family transcriptional regulator